VGLVGQCCPGAVFLRAAGHGQAEEFANHRRQERSVQAEALQPDGADIDRIQFLASCLTCGPVDVCAVIQEGLEGLCCHLGREDADPSPGAVDDPPMDHVLAKGGARVRSETYLDRRFDERGPEGPLQVVIAKAQVESCGTEVADLAVDHGVVGEAGLRRMVGLHADELAVALWTHHVIARLQVFVTCASF
jgi:hypothetical protein